MPDSLSKIVSVNFKNLVYLLKFLRSNSGEEGFLKSMALIFKDVQPNIIQKNY